MIQKASPHDVIVIGSGGGGLRAAIGAAEAGARTLVISRGKANRSGATLLAGANISADIACDGASLSRLGISDCNKNDTREAWFSDLLHEGFFLNNQELVSLFVETAADRVEELVHWGMKVRGMEGKRELSVFGSDILDTLYAKAKACGVEFMEDTIFCDLVTENKTVAGAVCLGLYSGELLYLPAKAVVLATGGAHNVFPVNSGSTDLCGEGQAAALRAGAELVDMEMVSFCPTVTLYPSMYRGNILPYIFFSTGYGNLRNKYGKTFTDKYLSKKVERLALDSEWNKMLLSYAIQSEINAGKGTCTGGVYFDLDLYPKEILEELYTDLPPLKTGIYADIMKILEAGRALTVAPAAHYFEGGVHVNANMETAVRGLYAAGECAGGMFGANRVSAATTEMLVEGARAGSSAGAYAREAGLAAASSDTLAAIESELLRPFANSGPRPGTLKKEIQDIAGGCLTVIRSGEKLEQALGQLNDMQDNALGQTGVTDQNRICNRQWLDYLEARSMLLTARAIVQSALLRGESRGVHIREDCFVTDNQAFFKNTVIENTSLASRLDDVKTPYMQAPRERMPYIDYIEQVVGKLN